MRRTRRSKHAQIRSGCGDEAGAACVPFLRRGGCVITRRTGLCAIPAPSSGDGRGGDFAAPAQECGLATARLDGEGLRALGALSERRSCLERAPRHGFPEARTSPSGA